MKNTLVHLFISATILFVSACSKDSGIKVSDEKNTSKISISGKSPEDFYNEFTFKKDERNLYRLVKTPGTFYYTRLDEAGKTRAELSLKMIAEDHTYEAVYSEHTDNTASSSTISYETTLHGIWSINGSTITFSNLAHGEGLTFNDNPAIALVFDKDIKTSGLAGKSILQQAVWSNKPDL